MLRYWLLGDSPLILIRFIFRAQFAIGTELIIRLSLYADGICPGLLESFLSAHDSHRYYYHMKDMTCPEYRERTAVGYDYLLRVLGGFPSFRSSLSSLIQWLYRKRRKKWYSWVSISSQHLWVWSWVSWRLAPWVGNDGLKGYGSGLDYQSCFPLKYNP